MPTVGTPGAGAVQDRPFAAGDGPGRYDNRPRAAAMSQPPCVLAIDLGTSGPKVGLVDAAGHVLGGEVEQTRLALMPPRGAEQDPADWWAAITRATRRLLARRLVSAEAIVGVGVTAQWSGTVAVDRDGQPLARAIIWLDGRGAPYAQQVTDGLVKIESYGLSRLLTWIRLTGGIPTRGGRDSIAHILYLKHEQPDLYQAAWKFLEPKDYLNLRLTGRCAASYDSITLHWLTDNRRVTAIDYHPRLLDLAGITRDKLPDLQRAVDILGPLLPEVAAQLGLPAGIPVVTGAPDLHSATIGSGAVRDFQPHLYVGTSGWLTCPVPFKKTDLFHNMASLPAAIPGRYFVANEQQTAGACLPFLRDNLLFPEGDGLSGSPPEALFPLLDQIVADTPAGSGGVMFLPWLNGERTPVEDKSVRASFVNVSLQTTRSHLIRAVYEGVALNARWLQYYLERFIGRPLGPINIVGGGAQADIWCQIFADELNRPIRQVADPLQVNTRGAGLLAAVGLGLTSFEQIADTIPIRQTFTPDPAHRRLYDERFDLFRQFYDRNKKLFRRLNG